MTYEQVLTSKNRMK